MGTNTHIFKIKKYFLPRREAAAAAAAAAAAVVAAVGQRPLPVTGGAKAIRRRRSHRFPICTMPVYFLGKKNKI